MHLALNQVLPYRPAPCFHRGYQSQLSRSSWLLPDPSTTYSLHCGPEHAVVLEA